MRAMLRIEMGKALKNRMFFAALAVAAAVALVCGVEVILQYQNMKASDIMSNEVMGTVTNPDLASATVFNRWIGQDFITLTGSLFFLLLPLLASFSYAWSLFSEQKSGYVKNVAARTLRKNYFAAKYAAVFLAGGLTALIPMLLNLMLVSSFIPAIAPDLFYDSSLGVGTFSLGAALFYSDPYLFVLFRLGLVFLFSGLFAAMSLALTFFLKNRFAVVLLPFVALVAFNYFSGLFYAYGELSPLKFIHGGALNPVKWWVVAAQAVLLFGLSFGIVMKKGIKDDIF